MIINNLLQRVQKPARYIGNELNAVYKKIDDETVRYLISYPDIYEIGMSNTGIRILYHILNKIEGVYCERTFAPWIDMAEEMKRTNTPLFSLETRTPAKEFDLWSFTLEYDLCLTNILLMLDIANVPFYAKDRKESDPVILAGGTLTYNPLPYEGFFDVIAIGEGEELLPYIMQIAKERKKGKINREEFLRILSNHESLYVPLYNDKKTIKQKAIVKELKDEDISVKDIIPNIEVVHHRMTIEIMRGCTRSCRFCQAGNVYKPLRLRNVESVVKIAKQMYKNTGMEELSLLSLSASDYPYLYELLDELMFFFDDKYVNISLPSLRGDALTEPLAERLSRIRKSSLTFAPEAGTERLRNIINKDIKEEDIFNSIEIAKKFGWKHIKLYYMIGLPYETDEDIDGLIDMVKRIKKIAGKMNVKVSVSPFVPRPVTPFERVKQVSMEYIREKNGYIKRELSKIKGVDVSLRNPEISFLEGIFSRGENLEHLIESAYRKGAIMDEWRETFNFTIWKEAIEENNINTTYILGEKENDLPWQFIKSPVSDIFLQREANKAKQKSITKDCRYANCYGCDACDLEIVGQMKDIKIPVIRDIEQKERKQRHGTIRIKFTKTEESRFFSYFDTVRFFTYALKRINLPIMFSEGFNPRPKIAPGPPLALGIASESEYMDIDIYDNIKNIFILNEFLPKGMKITKAYFSEKKLANINAYDMIVKYRIEPSCDIEKWDQFIEMDNIHFDKKSKKGKIKTVNLKNYIYKTERTNDYLDIFIKHMPQGTINIIEFVKLLYKEKENLNVIKKDMYVFKEGKLYDLIDLLKGENKDG